MPDYEFKVRVQVPDDAHAEVMADALMDAAIDEASEMNGDGVLAGDDEVVVSAVIWGVRVSRGPA